MTDFFDLEPELQMRRLRDAGMAALAQWEIEGAEVRLIKYRENAVFEVCHDGGRYALRIHRCGYHSDAALRSELQWMRALAASGILVPEVIATVNGEPFATCQAAGLPGRLQIDLFEWIDGAPLGSVEDGLADSTRVAEHYEIMGKLAAAVHNQSSAWVLPADFERHAWDAEGLAGRQPFWGRFWELAAATDAQRKLLVQTRDAVYEQLLQLPLTADHYSMIHADFVPENLIVDAAGVRLIDFDDAGFGWHLFELATSLYFILDDPCYETALQALISGYRSLRPLSDEQLALLPLFLTARGLTYLGWVHTRHETQTARELTPALLESACARAGTLLDI